MSKPVAVKSNGRHSPLLTHMMNKRDSAPPAAQPEQEPVAWMYTRLKNGSSIKLIEKRAEMPEGGWSLYKEEPLYTTPPAAQPPAEWELIKNILAEYGLDAIAFVAQWKAAQRPWVGLTDDEIDANQILRYHFSLNNGPVTRAGRAVVDTITAMLKAKNHG